MKIFGRKRDREQFVTYAEGVIDILSIEFGWDDLVIESARRNLLTPGDHLEFICDSPFIADWRLKVTDGYFRLAYYGQNPNDLEREEYLNRWFSNLKY